MGLSLIRLGAGRALLGVFGVILAGVTHVTNWDDVIQVLLGELDCVFLLSVESIYQTFPINILILSRVIPLVFLAHV